MKLSGCISFTGTGGKSHITQGIAGFAFFQPLVKIGGPFFAQAVDFIFADIGDETTTDGFPFVVPFHRRPVDAAGDLIDFFDVGRPFNLRRLIRFLFAK
jgi:hypothetical protein